MVATQPVADGGIHGGAGSRGVSYRGRVLTGEKRSFPGTQRTQPPEQTMERIKPYFPRAGITRLANITGLDHLGVPVTLAVRPTGRVLSVSSGKGLTLPAALVSGAMEALELYHAEVAWDPPTVRRSYDQVRSEYPAPDKADLPLAQAAPFPGNWPYLWTWGWDLLNQQEIALPVSLIRMGDLAGRMSDLFTFPTSSNGLASGNTLLEAVHAGLLEVIERDAVTCHIERGRRLGTAPPMVDHDDVIDRPVRELLEVLERAGQDVLLFDCTADTRVPVYMANLFDRARQVSGICAGYGAHLEPGIAMTRALTEAAQARLVRIAGSRDDLYRHRDVHRRMVDRDQSEARRQRPSSWLDGAPPVPSRPTTTFDGDVNIMLDNLRQAGLHQVAVVELTAPWCPVSVVKVVVPGLEGYRQENFTPGRRALAFAGGLEREASP